MTTVFNQTSRKLLAELNSQPSAVRSQVKGVGVFMVPDPVKGAGAGTSVALEDLTYAEATQRAQNCIAFKWIPAKYGNIEGYREAKQTNMCDGRLCLDADDCGPVGIYCVCYNNECSL